MYAVSTEEPSTTTPNNGITGGATDTSVTVETSSSADDIVEIDADTVSTVRIPMTDTVASTYFISTSITVPKDSLASATMAGTGNTILITFRSDVVSAAGFETFPDFTSTAEIRADTTPFGSLGLETGNTLTTPPGSTTACVTCYTTFSSSASATSSSEGTDTATSGIYTTNEIISPTQLNGDPAASTGAAAIPESIPRTDGPPCNLETDCSFTAGNERRFSSDILMLTPDVSVTPGLESVSFPDVFQEEPFTSRPLPEKPCCDVPLRVPSLNISPPDEGQLNVARPDVPLFDETLPNTLPPNTPPLDSPLRTLSPTQSPLYIIRPNVPLPDKPLPAVPPKERGFDDPSTGVSLVEVLTPDTPSPALPRPGLPLLDISPEVPRREEIPPDALPTYLSPVDVLTPDVSSTKMPLLDIVPGTRSSESPDNLSEPPLDAGPADVSVESLLPPSEQGGGNAVPDNTIDQPNSGNDLAPVEFTFPFLEDPKSVNPVVDSEPVLIDDPQNFPDDSSEPADGRRSNPLDSDQNNVLEKPNTEEKVNEETGSTGLISSNQNNASKISELDLSQAVEPLVVQVERLSSTVGPIQESDQDKSPEDKNKKEQNQEKGTKCSANWSSYAGMMHLTKINVVHF